MKQGGSVSICRGLLGAKLKLSNITSCIILLKGQLHAGRALSKRERGACPIEGLTRGGEVCGFLISFVRFVLFVALGGKNSLLAGRAARPESERGGWSREREGRGSGRGPRAPLAVPALYDAGA
eukprot:5537351-Pleurochrysis_carterae.AAC.1